MECDTCEECRKSRMKKTALQWKGEWPICDKKAIYGSWYSLKLNIYNFFSLNDLKKILLTH